MKTKLKLSILFLGFLFVLSGNPELSAQVTIGSGESPVEGALLQLKNNTGVTDEKENSTKGLAFPRVKLEQKNQLYPMYKTDADYPANKAVTDKQNTGLIVYNTFESPDTEVNPNLKFKKGLYLWTGIEWVKVATPGVDNGLNVTDQNIIRWGGNLSDSTTITADDKDIVFELKNFDSDDRNSGFMIKNLKVQPNSIAVVADTESGRLGLSPVIPARLAFVQSGTETRNPSNFNTRGYWTVPWDDRDVVDGGDIVTNNDVVEYNGADSSFVMKMDAMVEISGMVGYTASYGANDTQVIINSTMQIRKAGETDWVDYSSVRGVYIGAVGAYRNTLNIPPAMADLKEGDAIRLILARAPDGSGFLGSDHLVGGSEVPLKSGVVKPYGTQFSKMLKIIVQ
jgi:hypothetical protein